MKKPSVSAQVEGQVLARIEAPKMLSKLANVVELVIQPAWDDQSPKGDRCVMCFVSATLVKLLVKVEEPPLKLMVSGRSWDEAWAALEAVLRGEDVPWEQDVPRPPAGRQKKR